MEFKKKTNLLSEGQVYYLNCPLLIFISIYHEENKVTENNLP